MIIEGVEALYQKFPGAFLLIERPGLVPPRIVITRTNGEQFRYYVATDSNSGLNKPGDRVLMPALILGAGDRAIISDSQNPSTFLENGIEVRVKQ